jgi:hypothetical protein
MLEPILEQVHDIELLLLVGRIVFRANIENDALTPLIEVLDPIEQRNDQTLINVNTALVRQYLIDCFNGINGDQWVFILRQIIQLVQKVRLLEIALAQVEVLNASDDGCLFDIGVHIVEAFLQRVLHVFVHAIEFERAKRPQGKTSYLVIRRLQIHLEGVDGKDGELRVLLGVVD